MQYGAALTLQLLSWDPHDGVSWAVESAAAGCREERAVVLGAALAVPAETVEGDKPRESKCPVACASRGLRSGREEDPNSWNHTA